MHRRSLRVSSSLSGCVVSMASVRRSPIARTMNSAAAMPWPETSPMQTNSVRSSTKKASKRSPPDLGGRLHEAADVDIRAPRKERPLQRHHARLHLARDFQLFPQVLHLELPAL